MSIYKAGYLFSHSACNGVCIYFYMRLALHFPYMMFHSCIMLSWSNVIKCRHLVVTQYLIRRVFKAHYGCIDMFVKKTLLGGIQLVEKIMIQKQFKSNVKTLKKLWFCSMFHELEKYERSTKLMNSRLAARVLFITTYTMSILVLTAIFQLLFLKQTKQLEAQHVVMRMATKVYTGETIF